jgi:hypothetical protein
MLETVAFSMQMLETGFRIQDSGCRVHTLMMKSKKIQNSASSVESYPETRIQDKSILIKVFIATAKFEYSILYNYRDTKGEL